MVVRYLHRFPVFLAVLFLTITGAALGQNPAAPAPQAGASAAAPQRTRGPLPTPVNLQVLPKDTSPEQVIKIMHQFTGDLGVHCEFCHAKNAETGRLDFASDANPMKNSARVMLRMANAINSTYLTQLTDSQPATPVTCGTCHRGMTMPPAFVPTPERRPAPR